MKERFEGPNADNLTTALKRQEFTDGNDTIVAALKENGELIEFAKGDLIVAQDSEGDELYFLLTGSVAIVVNGNHIATRTHGKLVGEMAAVEPTLRRSADVRALDTVVALKVSSATLNGIGKDHPEVWQLVARELARRLNERNSLIPRPNEKPKLFIISSVEGLEIAREVQSALAHDALITVWTDGVFFVRRHHCSIWARIVAGRGSMPGR
jgi:CRP/FNR family transcriptional regulator, cyclic AMP receptor protein